MEKMAGLLVFVFDLQIEERTDVTIDGHDITEIVNDFVFTRCSISFVKVKVKVPCTRSTFVLLS